MRRSAQAVHTAVRGGVIGTEDLAGRFAAKRGRGRCGGRGLGVSGYFVAKGELRD